MRTTYIAKTFARALLRRYCPADWLGIVVSAFGMMGCGSEKDSAWQSGTLSMNLSTEVNSVRYRLREAVFDIAGPEALTLSSEDDLGDDAAIGIGVGAGCSDPAGDCGRSTRRALMVGDYQANLRKGWQLEKQSGDVFQTVDGALISDNPEGFRIEPAQTTDVAYTFETDGTIVHLGRGTLNLGIEVRERPGSQEPAMRCPAGATFCTSFEGQGLPSPATFVIGGDSSLMPQFTLDTSQARSGRQSFMIPATSPGFSYRALTIPAPGQDFWARMYVRVDTAFGDGNHDSLFGASNANQTQDNSNEVLIELSEQFGYMLLNTNDCSTTCNRTVTQMQLPANTWACMEAHYDGTAGHVEIFLNGTRFIDDSQTLYRFTYQTFRIGYMRYNTQRTVWFDDVVLARSQVGCN